MKSRPDSFYARLSERDQEVLFRKVRPLSLVDACALAKAEYGLKASKSAMARFRVKMEEDFARALREALQASSLRARETAEAAPIPPAVIAESLRAMGARLIELGDEERGFKYLQNAANMDRIAAELSKQKLDRDKFEAAEKRLASVKDALGAAKTAGGLTPETLKKIEEAAGLL